MEKTCVCCRQNYAEPKILTWPYPIYDEVFKINYSIIALGWYCDECDYAVFEEEDVDAAHKEFLALKEELVAEELAEMERLDALVGVEELSQS